MDDAAVSTRTRRRADIQGLRAVAVLAVVVGHTGAALPGGFVGVDVFFVISGYVIGSLLLREARRAAGVSLTLFYARRARRLLPSLAVLVVVAVAVGVVVLNPYVGQPAAFRTALWSSVFLANVELYRHVGYFDAGAEAANPFLHLWSLSVEEQFYLALPVLLLLARRVAGRDPQRLRRWLQLLVGGVALLSFAASWYLTVVEGTSWPEAPARFAFFMAPIRFWELAAGVLLATLVPTERRAAPSAAGGAAAWLGAGLIVAAVVLTDPLAPFPGLAAVPAVAGAVLLLARAEATLVGRALSARPLTWIGDRSYTWYLWHWPAIVYARAVWPASAAAPVVAAVVSLLPAALVYRTVEDPLRRDPVGRPGRTAVLAVGCTGAIVVASLVGLRGAAGGWGVEEPSEWWERADARSSGCVLVNRDIANEWPEEACTFGPSDSTGTVLVVGDSHAASLVEPFAALAAERGMAVSGWARAGCPASRAAPQHYPRCREWQEAVLEQVVALQPEVVVLANRSTDYTTDRSHRSTTGPIGADGGPTATSEAGRIEVWGAGLVALVAELRQLGAIVVVVGGPPTYRGEFPVATILRPGATPPTVPRSEMDRRHEPVVAAERGALAGLEGVAYVDPMPLLCGPEACTAQIGGRWTHQDAVDLNDHGGELLVPALERAWAAAEASAR